MYVQAIVFCAILLVEFNQILFPTLICIYVHASRMHTCKTFRKRNSHNPECTETTTRLHNYTLTRCDKNLFVPTLKNKRKIVDGNPYHSISVTT